MKSDSCEGLGLLAENSFPTTPYSKEDGSPASLGENHVNDIIFKDSLVSQVWHQSSPVVDPASKGQGEHLIYAINEEMCLVDPKAKRGKKSLKHPEASPG